MNIFAISALINAITSLTLGLFVFFKIKRKAVNNAFILLSFAVFVWSVFYCLWQNATDYDSALLYTRLLSLGSTLIPIFYLHWVSSFLEIKDKANKIILFLGYVITFIFLLLSFSPFYIKGVEEILVFDFWPKAGPLYTIYILFSYVGLVGYGLVRLFKSYFSSLGLKRYQIQYVIFGTVIGFLGGATNFFLWYNIKVLPFGNVVVSLYVFILFYAMIRYRLMDIRVVARKIFIYFTISAFVYGFFYFLIWLYSRFFGGLFTTASYSIGVLMAPLFVAAFYALDRYIKNVANKYLFVSLYNYQETINKLIDELTTYIDLDKIINLIVDTIKETMHLDRADIFLASADNDPAEYQVFKIKGREENGNPSFPKSDILIKCLLKNQKILVKDELMVLANNSVDEKEKNNLSRLGKYMEKMNISLYSPLVINKRLIGVIILGSKISGDPYTREDLDLLTVLSKQASIAIENAYQYKQIQEFGKTLQARVDEQTIDIKSKNEELKRLLEARTEFLSIASHQLRTPLTAIRGHTSMLKKGDYGDLSEEAQKSVNYVYDSSVRMIELVNNLLSVNRLERDTIKLNLKEISIDEIIKECIEDIRFAADDKKITVKYSNGENMPLISGDYEKIKNALGNIINNAVLYTIKGGVEIKTSVISENELKIEIKDTGIGLEKEDLKKIFNSFSRGRGGTELYTQGIGLGLYIAKSFIEMHGGTIEVASEGRNKGSLFTIVLPVKPIKNI
ncbi:MAG: ATP-binding protein [Candidatus Paceibacterota bacterium]|jgi:signal transduction histidine kinase